jgi:hypothetical protein
MPFARGIAQIMGEQGPPLVEEGQIILLGIITTTAASIYSCDPMLYEAHLCMIAENFQ